MADTPTPDPSKTVKTVENTARVLEAVYELGSAGVSEIAEKVDISKGAVYRHLVTLENEGFMIKRDSAYEMGTRHFCYGTQFRKRSRIYQAGGDPMDALAEDCGEYTQMMVEFDGRGVFIYEVAGQKAIRAGIGIGQPLHLHTTAAGKAMLSELPDERVVEIIDTHGLPKVTKNTLTDSDALFEELESIRDTGISKNTAEHTNGIRAVGTAITDQHGELLGSISVSGPTSRIKGETFTDEIPEMLRRTANIIEINVSP